MDAKWLQFLRCAVNTHVQYFETCRAIVLHFGYFYLKMVALCWTRQVGMLRRRRL